MCGRFRTLQFLQAKFEPGDRRVSAQQVVSRISPCERLYYFDRVALARRATDSDRNQFSDLSDRKTAVQRHVHHTMRFVQTLCLEGDGCLEN
jgi:hypothetical protein